MVISTFEHADYDQPTLKFPCGRTSACGDVASKNLHTVLLSRSETDVLSLEVKMINVDNKVVKGKRETCKRGNSSVCPRSTLNPASLVKTDPSLTLKISSVLQFSPVKVPVDDNLQPSICARSCIPNLPICRSSCFHLQETSAW